MSAMVGGFGGNKMISESGTDLYQDDDNEFAMHEFNGNSPRGTVMGFKR